MFAFDIDLRVKPLFDPSVPHPTPPLRNFAFDTHATKFGRIQGWAEGRAFHNAQASARDGASSGVGDDQNRPTKAQRARFD